jgi:hypothetical protein
MYHFELSLFPVSAPHATASSCYIFALGVGLLGFWGYHFDPPKSLALSAHTEPSSSCYTFALGVATTIKEYDELKRLLEGEKPAGNPEKFNPLRRGELNGWTQDKTAECSLDPLSSQSSAWSLMPLRAPAEPLASK